MKLLAIDGNSLINRAFYGIRPLSTTDGRPTGALYGFITILNRLKENEKPDAVAVAFDLKAPTFRHKEYALYKAGRKPMPDDLRSQIPLLKEWLTLYGYKVLEKEGFEADDILGTLADICKEGGDTCVIATGDRDSFQLIDKSTYVVLSSTKAGSPETTVYNEETLFEKYSLSPKGMLELKALMGDSSDNIPGVAGVGEKTATELIKNFSSVDGVYENIDSPLIKDSVRNKLIVGKESAYLSRFLGTISKEVPISRNFSDYLPKEKDEEKLGAFMTDLELFKLMNAMGISKVEKKEAKEKGQEASVLTVTEEDFIAHALCDIAYDGEFFAFVSGGKAVLSKDGAFIKKILESESEKRVYDCKNLYKFAVKNQIEIKNIVFDPMLGAYLADANASSYEMDRLIDRYHISAKDENALIERAIKTGLLSDVLKEELLSSGQEKLLSEVELPLAEVLANMELDGVRVDKEGLYEMGKALEKDIALLEEEIYSLIGYEFNLNSPKQLGIALFEKLGLYCPKKTKSGYSTSAEVLNQIKYDHPAVEKLLLFRSKSKLKSTYCDGLLNAISDDGRIHSTFNQTETRTGRISSLEPNLQNIPVRTEEGRKLRQFFIAKEGYSFCDADYSQIELRVLASIADDKNMIDAFNSDKDIHTSTAAQVFSMPESMVTKELRSKAKAVNFGIVYGIGAFSLSKDIGVTRKEADDYIKGYLSAYKGVDRYMKEVISKAKEDGFVTTLMGRRRYLPEITASNGMLRAFGERVARNAPIQGSAADIIKIAMVKVFNRLKETLKDARLILQVHDELIVECKDEDKERVCALLKEEMEKAYSLSVKLIADASCGRSWYDAKE